MIAFSATGRTRRIVPTDASSTNFTLDGGGSGQNTVFRIANRFSQTVNVVFGDASATAPSGTADNVEHYPVVANEVLFVRAGAVTHGAARAQAAGTGALYITPGILA